VPYSREEENNPAFFSDETDGRTISEFIALRAKSCALEIDNVTNTKAKKPRCLFDDTLFSHKTRTIKIIEILLLLRLSWFRLIRPSTVQHTFLFNFPLSNDNSFRSTVGFIFPTSPLTLSRSHLSLGVPRGIFPCDAFSSAVLKNEISFTPRMSCPFEYFFYFFLCAFV